jgi:TolB-like protein/Tfp pilus assembly protein PilF
MSILERLKERRVVQWGLSYLGVAWVIVQVADAVGDQWNIPAPLLRRLDILLLTGLFFVLVIAWNHGKRGRQRVSGLELLILAGLTVASGTLLSLAGGESRVRVESEQQTAPAPEGTIAVLPFIDLSPEGNHRYFADGVAEEIVSALTRDDRIRVAARTSSFALRDRPVSEVGEILSVAAVLEGSVRTDGEVVRITARLVDAADGFEIWARQFDRSLDRILEIQEEISSSVVAELVGAPQSAVPTQRIPPEAYDSYLQARFFWNRRSESDLLRSVELFTRATELAPEYARAYSGLADTYAVLGFYQYLPPEEAFPNVARFAREALALDPDLPDALAAIAYARLYYEWDWAAAEEAFQRAIQANPGYPVAHQWYGNLLVVLGRTEEAVVEIRTALELDPLSMIARSALPWAYHYGREYERALELFMRNMAMDETFMVNHYFMGATLAQMGDLEEAIRAFERAIVLSDSSAIAVAGLARTLAAADRPSEAEALLDRLLDPSRTPAPPRYEIAKVHLALGRAAEGFEWLDQAYRHRAPQLPFLGVDPDLDSWRTDDRFIELVAAMNLDGLR